MSLSSSASPFSCPADQVPDGYRVIVLDSTDSTNAEAMRRAETGAGGRLWIRAREQTQGRGRRGRIWVSEPGNLFASLLLEWPQTRRAALPFLPLLAGLAAYDTAQALITGDDDGHTDHRGGLSGDPSAIAQPSGKLLLKWPNDILLDGGKISGTLVETRASLLAPRQQPVDYVVIGTGLNLQPLSEPARADLPHAGSLAGSMAGSLVGQRCNLATPAQALAILMQTTARWLHRFEHSSASGFDWLCRAWQARSFAPGTKLQIMQNDRHLAGNLVSGCYEGISSDGALRLRTDQGELRTYSYGDVSVLPEI